MRHLFFTLFLTVAISSQVLAQSEVGPEQKWAKICLQSGGQATPAIETCNIRHALYTRQGQLVASVNLATRENISEDAQEKLLGRVFQLIVPSWRAIPPGVAMKIDEGETLNLAYTICLPNRCLAEIPLSDELIAELKAGAKLNVVSYNFRNKEHAVDLSLQGFSKAWEGPPLAQEEIAAQQNQLENVLQEKEQETRRKLIEAQSKAKEESGG